MGARGPLKKRESDRSRGARERRPGGRRSNPEAAPEAMVLPPVPRGLELRGEGSKAMYRDACAVLHARDGEVATDTAVMAALLANEVAVYGRAKAELHAYIRDKGTMFEATRDGRSIAHGAHRVMGDQIKRIKELCGELGLGPAARRRLGLEPDDGGAEDPLARYTAGGAYPRIASGG